MSSKLLRAYKLLEQVGSSGQLKGDMEEKHLKAMSLIWQGSKRVRDEYEEV